MSTPNEVAGLISSFRFTLDRAAAAHSLTVARIHLRMALGAFRLLRSAGADLAPLAEQLDAVGHQFAARGWLQPARPQQQPARGYLP